MRAASRSFAIEYAKGIRVDDPGMGITKIWDMYRKEFRFEEEILGRDAFEDLLSQHCQGLYTYGTYTRHHGTPHRLVPGSVSRRIGEFPLTHRRT